MNINIKLLEIILLILPGVILPVLGLGLFLLPGVIRDLLRRE